MSSKNARKLSAPTVVSMAKRSKHERTIIEPSESILWPETEDSLFTDSKLEGIFNSKELQTNGNIAKDTNFYDDNVDDSLFSDIVMPEQKDQSENVGGTPMEQVLPATYVVNAAYCNDSLFSEIDIDVLVANSESSAIKKEVAKLADDVLPTEKQIPIKTEQSIQEPNLFEDDINVEQEALNQCTQKFLDDIQFKIPKAPELNFLHKNTESVIDQIIQGTQYATRAEIKNQTILNSTYATVTNKELQNLSNINWESQIFNEDVKEKDSFPSKGDFYGLPDRVKRLIFEHKGISSLYGKLFKFFFFLVGDTTSCAF